MKLTFIRADHEVTGSCTLLEIGGHYGLIDCGMEQGRDLFENIAIPVPAAQIEFVLVTHAHMDHTGHLPLLYKQGFRGTVYATEATCDLCGIMLRDAAHIQMSEAEWKGAPPGANRLSCWIPQDLVACSPLLPHAGRGKYPNGRKLPPSATPTSPSSAIRRPSRARTTCSSSRLTVTAATARAWTI